MTKFLRYTSAALAIAIGVLYFHGYAKPPTTWWYPFINSLFSDYYTTGPFAMTSNTREDNPIWQDIAGFNQTQARLTYAMSRGEPEAQIAWLFAAGEWADSPGAIGGTPDPNAVESAMSKALVAAGYSYDRVSRQDLTGASADGEQLQVGAARYQVLLIDNLPVAEPQLLASVLELARQGVRVLWQGHRPTRAAGWSDHQARDEEIMALRKLLDSQVTSVQLDSVREVLSSLNIEPTLAVLDGTAMRLRSQSRILEGGQLILLFNEHSESQSSLLLPSSSYSYVELMTPESGEAHTLKPGASGGLTLDIPARRTRILYLHDEDAGDCQSDNAHCFDKAAWQQPTRSMHPYIRWWWPGNAVEKPELLAELNSLHRAGFGGVELQTLTIGFPQQYLQQQQASIYQVGSPAYLDNVKTVLIEAERLGMTVDLTLGSGWSSGGPFIDEFPEQQLLMSSIDIAGPTEIDLPLPQVEEPFYVTPTNWVIKNTLGDFDKNAHWQTLLAAKIDSQTSPPTLSDIVDMSESVIDGRIQWQVPAGDYRLIAFYQNNTAHNVAASAYSNGLEQSLVVDHLNPGGVQEYIQKLGQPWLDALQPHQPNALFVDSFELIGELPWSSVFFDTFQSMHGYDARLYLPFLFKQRGESKYVNVVVPPEPAYQAVDNRAERIREDYELAREHLFQQSFLRPLQQWTASQGIKLRVQAHGGYGDYLDSYKMADIPESEGLFASGSYDFLKLASSAAHVAGRRFVSSESFIMLTLNFNALTLEDYYLLAGNAFSAGINRTIYHGYAYHYAY